MPKKLQDISEDENTPRLNLKKKKRATKKTGRTFNKYNPISEVKDLSGKENSNFLYLRGKRIETPRYLGNLLRVAGIGFLILLLINSVNAYFEGLALERQIKGTAEEGYSYLVSAGKDAGKIEFEKAIKAFDSALENFSAAENSLWFINTDHSLYAKDRGTVKAINNLLEGGQGFARAGSYFLSALEEFNKIPIYFISKNSEQNIETPSITDTLHNGLEYTNQAISEIDKATSLLNAVDEKDLPDEIALRLGLAKDQVNSVNRTLHQVAKHFPALLKLLGDRYPHRYLILLQNNNEIRPTGGFIGSYAIVDVNEGHIEELKIEDVYDIDGSFGGQIDPPVELAEFADNWRFRDSNYHPDFPTSAAKARWFLETEGGPTVDTVIAINQGLLKDLLEITGPVQVGEFGTLDSENYNLLLTYVIEGKVWGAEDPKHILKVFIPAFREAILKEENIGRLSSKLYRAIQQKHIMFWSADQDVEDLFDAAGFSGRMHPDTVGEDYLSVVHASIGGTKSDQFIEETITHNSTIEKNGTVIDEVTVTRSHKWDNDIYRQWRDTLRQYGFNEMPDYLIDILGRGTNIVSTRIYVPAGSELIESNKEDIKVFTDEISGHTYFMADMQVSAGGINEFTVKYRLPERLKLNPTATYRLITEKQPGSVGSLFNKSLTLDKSFSLLSSHPDQIRLNGNTLNYSDTLVYDRNFSVLVGR